MNPDPRIGVCVLPCAKGTCVVGFSHGEKVVKRDLFVIRE